MEIDQGIGSVSSSGSRDVSPTQDTTYTLTARNDDGQSTKTCTITVSAAPIKTGEWTATADFGTFDFTVSSDSSYITVSSNGNSIPKITYNFSNWSVGGVTISGTIIISSNPSWPISDRSFEITNTLSDNQQLLTVRGTFSDSGDQASGTWDANIYGSTASGTWQGSTKN